MLRQDVATVKSKSRGQIVLIPVGFDLFERDGQVWAGTLGVVVRPIQPAPDTRAALLTAAGAAWKIREYLTTRGWPIPTAVRGPASEIMLLFAMHVPKTAVAGLIDELTSALRQGARR